MRAVRSPQARRPRGQFRILHPDPQQKRDPRAPGSESRGRPDLRQSSPTGSAESPYFRPQTRSQTPHPRTLRWHLLLWLEQSRSSGTHRLHSERGFHPEESQQSPSSPDSHPERSRTTAPLPKPARSFRSVPRSDWRHSRQGLTPHLPQHSTVFPRSGAAHHRLLRSSQATELRRL